MAHVEFLPRVYQDLQRIVSHLEQHEVEHVPDRLGELVSAFDVLTDNPLIGRPIHGDLRALVIGRSARGYVALYQYAAALETVFVLGVRAQRESGYPSDA